MAGNVEMLATSDRDRWLAVLAEAAQYDFYHLPQYHEISERAGEGRGQLFVYRQQGHVIALPLLTRQCNSIEGLEDVSALDATSVYGYAGPVSSDPNPPSRVIAGFQSSLRDALVAMRVATLFARLHPLLPQSSLISGLGKSAPSGTTVSLDLSLPEAAQVAGIRKNHVRGIRKLRNLGATCIYDSRGSIDEFVQLYYETMQRVGATPAYFFDHDYFAQLDAMRGSYVHMFTCRLNQETIAAGLFFTCNDIVQYHLGATRVKHNALGPMKLILDTVRTWAGHRGMRVLHLGGGLGAREDSLFHFKAGFSNRRHSYATWRWVIDQRQYEAMITTKAKWNAEHQVRFLPAAHFFPKYRGAVSPIRSGDVAMQVRDLKPPDAGALGDLLPRIDGRFFQPHPMTSEEAARIAELNGRDVYLLGFVDGEAVAYGMLRGWDEGYTVPSLGVGVRRDQTRRGYGRAMMHALHDAARRLGAKAVRLRVHPDNLAAATLYRSLGYREAGFERGEVLMLLDL